MSMTPLTNPDYAPELEALLTYIKRSRGFDFTGYKRTSLTRRIQRRMQVVGTETYTDYLDYLEVHPDEFGHLFDAILINVTNFFRDSIPWEYLSSEIIPQIIAAKKDDTIRIWDAGCASGEEAFTIAILMAEALGPEKFRDRVKIYASDVDEGALLQARSANYTLRDVATVPPDYVDKYFEQFEQRLTFRKDLRRTIIFGRHDLIQDAPISRVDLLICRNVLMYFNADTQSKILAKFHFALNETGYLMLGKAEMLFTHAALFQPVDLRRRIFQKVPRVALRDRLLMMSQAGDEDAVNNLSRHVRYREAAFDASPVAQIVIDLNAIVVLANERARALLGISKLDLSRPLHELDVSYRIPDLRQRVEEVQTEHRPSVLKEAEWTTSSGDIRTLEVQVLPLFENGSSFLGVTVTFTDLTRYKRLQEEIEHSNQELETAYEELQSTNEELETTNEELQSTVEELETTNEELQSTNEELETMNEELQSANEELQTMNDELRRRTDEMNQINAFLESILTSMRGAVVVVDQDLAVQVWSQKADDLWGLRANEAQGRNFLNLDIGLPVEQLKGIIRSCLAGESEYTTISLAATNRRGRGIHCKVTCTPLYNSNRDGRRGAILLMEELEGSESPAK
ncbi:MAG: PAS domain S-box protein [Anaerolineae bacterium]|nr:PAS domain S-box protein [Anaerolineae bacterium]